MEAQDMKLIEKLQSDFDKCAAKEGWTPQEICLMKDLEKIMYYIEAREALKNGQQGGYNDEFASGARGRRSYDGYSGRGNGSGMYYDDGMSGRRYYDDEKEHSVRRLRNLMENETNHEVKMAIQNVLRQLETR